MVEHMSFDLAEFRGGYSIVPSQFHRIKPKLAFAFRRTHVYVRRLISLVGVKMESVSTDPQDSRHSMAHFCSLLRQPDV